MTTLIYFQFLGALCLLLFSSEILVRSSLRLARRYNLSDAIVGLVIIGFGTSIAELTASVQAVLHGSPEISIGNIVGSNIANILLILGIGAVICPIPEEPRTRVIHIIFFVLAAVCLSGLHVYGILTPVTALIFLLLLVIYLVLVFRYDEKGADASTQGLEPAMPSTPGVMVGVGLGLAGAIFGADWLVQSALSISQRYGIPESVFGLTIVAVGTSLPELAATVSAAWRRRTGLVFGNIIGSNIFNVLGITGFVGLFGALNLKTAVTSVDMFLLCLATLVAAIFMRWGGIGRVRGGLMLAGYAIYIVFMTG